jgi:hypothetical protein
MELKKITVNINNLLLDPNNPRFADISDDSLNIPENRFAESEVQRIAFDKMMHPKFDVTSLAKSVETVGFLPVDNLVAKKVLDDKYVIVEGNRRTTAIKYLINEYKKGQSTMSEEAIKSLQEIDILLIENSTQDTGYIGMVIQGIRNVSGIKEWDAYQKAQFINNMVEKGKEPYTIAKMIGMQVKDVNRYHKTYCVMNQFKNDTEYGTYWKLSYFSHFDEILKKPVLRGWFGWNDEKYLFENINNIKRFYDWLVPDENGETTFKESREVRCLPELITDSTALNYLDDKNLQKALNYVTAKNFNNPIVSFTDCMDKINSAITAFKDIVGEGYEQQLTSDEVDILEKKIDEIVTQLGRIKKLKAND